MKPTVKRNLMLNFIGETFSAEENVNTARIFKCNNKQITDGNIFYIMSRELRVEDNFGLNFATELAEKYSKKLNIIIFIDKNVTSCRQIEFLENNLVELKENLKINKLEYKIIFNDIEKEIKNAGGVVFDFNPVAQNASIKTLNCAAFEVDSHNIIPARFISQKQEFSAATLRKKVYSYIGKFLTEYKKIKISQKHQIYEKLKSFIETKLEKYHSDKNNPNFNNVSGLSPYLHFGLISSQRVAIEIIKSNVSNEAKEAFLEELIVRKELSDNFCLYAKDFKSLGSIPNWAKETLFEHKSDLRTYTYTLEEFEHAKTNEALWNAAQKQLLYYGKIHGYLRMYWAKKILEWTKSPEEALKIAIYLNDTFAFDGNDSNGYVGILWSIGGLHDRAFVSRPVFGKIRYMSLNGCKNKFDVEKFITSLDKI